MTEPLTDEEIAETKRVLENCRPPYADADKIAFMWRMLATIAAKDARIAELEKQNNSYRIANTVMAEHSTRDSKMIAALVVERDADRKRLALLEEVVFKAAPTHWAVNGDVDGAVAWEKEVAALGDKDASNE